MAAPQKVRKNGKLVRDPSNPSLIKWKIRYRGPNGWTSGICWGAKVADAYMEIARREGMAGSIITWSEGLALWLREHSEPGANYRSDSTRYQYELTVNLFVDAFGDKAVADTTRGEINRFLSSRAQSGPAAANRSRCILSLANWLARHHDVEWTCRNRDFPTYSNAPQRPRRDLTLDHIGEYMRAVSDRSVKRRGGKIVKASPWIFRFLFLTGVRVSEAAGLLEENVADGELRFRQKGNRLRSLPISKAAMREIQRSVSGKRRLGIGIPNVFFNCAGKPWNKDTIRRYWNRRIEAAGLPHRTPHEIRHTFCTLAGAEGFNVFQIQSASGHETASMLERYVHDSSEAALAVGEAVTERLGSVLYPNRTQNGGDSGEPASIYVNPKLPKGGVPRECPHCGKPLSIKTKGRNP